jgi:hypothetical protein
LGVIAYLRGVLRPKVNVTTNTPASANTPTNYRALVVIASIVLWLDA